MDLSAKRIDVFAQKCNLKKRDNKRALLSRLWITRVFITGIGLSGGCLRDYRGHRIKPFISHLTNQFVYIIRFKALCMQFLFVIHVIHINHVCLFVFTDNEWSGSRTATDPVTSTGTNYFQTRSLFDLVFYYQIIKTRRNDKTSINQ